MTRAPGARLQRPHPGPRLNPSQERALAITLRLLEERLAGVSAMLDHAEHGVLYRRPRPALAADSRGAIDRLATELRASIRSLAETFRLPVEEQDAASRAAASLALSWESLGEVTERRMRSFGSTDPGLAEVLDPAVEHLMGLVLELETAISASGTAESRE